jgi:hypothetical protein
VENVNIISDKTMALAINSGSANIVESVLKKWRKNKERTLNEFNLLSIACSSRHLSLAVVQQLLPLYNKAKEHVQSTKEEGHEYLKKLCKSLNISLVKRRSLLTSFNDFISIAKHRQLRPKLSRYVDACGSSLHIFLITDTFPVFTARKNGDVSAFQLNLS